MGRGWKRKELVRKMREAWRMKGGLGAGISFISCTVENGQQGSIPDVTYLHCLKLDDPICK